MHSASLPLLQYLPRKISANPNLNANPKPSVPSRFRFLRSRCANSEANDPSDGAVAGMVDELLKREENRPLLQGLVEASERVERAREALADIERQESEAMRAKEYVLQLENRKSEIEESQRELLEARTKVEEAQHSLSLSMDENSSGDDFKEDINRDAERWESAKAALVSSVIGTFASLPISFSQETSYPQLILHSAITFLSCALFGVTFRYAIRRDLDNIQLKTGASAAFGFVKGLAAVEAGKPLELNISSFIEHSVDGAVYVSENVFIFLSAAVALDFCFKMKLLSPFPVRKAN